MWISEGYEKIHQHQEGRESYDFPREHLKKNFLKVIFKQPMEIVAVKAWGQCGYETYRGLTGLAEGQEIPHPGLRAEEAAGQLASLSNMMHALCWHADKPCIAILTQCVFDLQVNPIPLLGTITLSLTLTETKTNPDP